MADVVISVLQLAAYGFVFLILIVAEYLDWFGRLEVLEAKHPNLHRLVLSRPLRLVLLLLIVGMLVENTKDVIKRAEGEQAPLSMKFSAPQAPDVCKELPRSTESPNSLRRRTMKLADEFYEFMRKRHEHHPPYGNANDPNPSPDTQKMLATDRAYDQETRDQYNRLYRDRFIEIIRQYQARGVHVGWLESLAQNGNLAWALPGSSWEDTPQDNLATFRGLAYRVDADDNLIVLTY